MTGGQQVACGERVLGSVGSVSSVSCESSVRGLPPFLMVFFVTTYTMMMTITKKIEYNDPTLL